MNRAVIITGGTKGLGLELALEFSRAGNYVMVVYSADHAAADCCRNLLESQAGGGCVVQYDVTSDDPTMLHRREIRNSDSLVLIHNACASFTPTPMHQLKWPAVEHELHVAVKGGWLLSQEFIRPMLKKRDCVIVTVLSSVICGPSPKGFASYVTAKHALRGLTLALASEYADRGVKVFSASPGFMDTPLTAAWDSRLSEKIRTGSTRISHPPTAAKALLALVQNPHTEGKGEDYKI